MMDFGKFYTSSYLDVNGNMIKPGLSPVSSPTSPQTPKTPNFHRPENFSYSSHKRFSKPKKTGIYDLLRSPSRVVVVRERAKSVERSEESEKVIKLSRLPPAEEKHDIPAIEREDWPAPPATAVITKNMVRASLLRKPDTDSDNEEEQEVDPKIKKELEEISKIHDSPMADVIRQDLTLQIETHKKKQLDPRSASRTPSASKEPHQPYRFISPVNASPSRCKTDRPRGVSDSALKNGEDKRRSIVHSTVTSNRYKIKPGYSYGIGSKSLSLSTTVPPGTPGAYVYDQFHGYESSDDDEPKNSSKNGSRVQIVDLVSRDLPYSNDDDSVFERASGLRSSTVSDYILNRNSTPKKISSYNSATFDGAPFLNAARFDYRKRSESVLSLWEELLFGPTEPVPYEEVRLSSANRRKGLSNSNLEKHLSDVEFERHLGTTRDEFYRLPEFKRNDIKKKMQHPVDMDHEENGTVDSERPSAMRPNKNNNKIAKVVGVSEMTVVKHRIRRQVKRASGSLHPDSVEELRSKHKELVDKIAAKYSR